MTAQLVTLWLDSARVGCGTRTFLLLKQGRKWARLLYPPTLTVVTVGVDEMGKAEVRAPSRGFRARLRHIAAMHRRLGLNVNRAALREALALLDASSAKEAA